MVRMISSDEIVDEWEGWLKEFHKFWKEMGEPHPNSNKYLLLNRVFFFEKGMEKGSDLAGTNYKTKYTGYSNPPSNPSTKGSNHG